MNAPRMSGVWNTTFQNALQSTSRIKFRHQSGPPPCSAPKTSVPALFALALSGPLTLAEPVAASASAASTTPAKSQSFGRCIYSLLLRPRSANRSVRAPLRDRGALRERRLGIARTVSAHNEVESGHHSARHKNIEGARSAP